MAAIFSMILLALQLVVSRITMTGRNQGREEGGEERREGEKRREGE